MSHNHRTSRSPLAWRFALSAMGFAALCAWQMPAYAAPISANAPIVSKDVADIIPKVFVDEEYILLGQIFTSAGEYTERRIAAAPPPGQTVVFRAKWLWRVAYRYQIPWRPFSEDDTVSVTRNARKITSEEIIAKLHMYLRTSEPQLTAEIDQGIVALAINSSSQHVLLPTNVEHTIDFHDLQIDYPNKRITTTAIIAQGTSAEIRQLIQGHLQRYQYVWVPTRQIGPKDVISQSDLQQIRLPQDRIIQMAALDVDAIIGKSPRQFLQPLQPINQSFLTDPVLVHKNQVVTVIYKSKSITLTTKARALQDGSKNDFVRVKNMHNGSQIEGAVVGLGVVRVDGNV